MCDLECESDLCDLESDLESDPCVFEWDRELSDLERVSDPCEVDFESDACVFESDIE